MAFQMSALTRFEPCLRSVSRFVIAFTYSLHGWQKFFGMFGGIGGHKPAVDDARGGRRDRNLRRRVDHARPVHTARGVPAGRRDGGRLLPHARAAGILAAHQRRRTGRVLLLLLPVAQFGWRGPMESRSPARPASLTIYFDFRDTVLGSQENPVRSNIRSAEYTASRKRQRLARHVSETERERPPAASRPFRYCFSCMDLRVYHGIFFAAWNREIVTRSRRERFRRVWFRRLDHGSRQLRQIEPNGGQLGFRHRRRGPCAGFT